MSRPFPPEKRQEWAERISQQKASGLSIERWCRKHQLCSQKFHYWKRRLFPKKAQFAELEDHTPCFVRIEYGQVQIQVKAPSLKQGLRALQEIRC